MTALLILQRYWKPIGVGIVALAFFALIAMNSHTAKQRDAAKTDAAQARAALQTQISTYQAAATKAQADAKAKEARDAQITQETQNDLQAQLAAARDSATAYARRLSNPAAQGNPGSGASVSQAADTAGSVDGTGGQTLVDDLRICSDNTVKAQGWQDWWAKVNAGQ